MTRTLIETSAPRQPGSVAELEHLIARGRQLQAEAVQDAFRGLFRYLVGGCSLRVMRLPGPLPGQRQTCC